MYLHNKLRFFFKRSLLVVIFNRTSGAIFDRNSLVIFDRNLVAIFDRNPTQLCCVGHNFVVLGIVLLCWSLLVPVIFAKNEQLVDECLPLRGAQQFVQAGAHKSICTSAGWRT
jgi:hypothetical protein